MMALVLAVLIGLSLGILGSGGSIVTLPVLVYVAKIPPSQAVGMSLAIVGGTSLLGALLQFRKGNLHLKAVLLFSITGIIGAFLGSGATHLLSKQALLLVFAAIMLVVGSLMLSGRPRLKEGRKCQVWPCLVVGLVVGVLTGFLGVGGGFLIVPALVMAAGLSVRMSGGTSLAIIALNSASGLVGQSRFVRVDWALLVPFLALACGGMLAGLAFANRVPDKNLRRIFAGALIALAIFVVAMNV
ncbi:MAG TPA: sulfite exporter TauE/SafE family protein [Bryobacteraceae bacterium]|nr:sulfite exporter TauE/SafE family protein [Bryobacteraceae bacterium]